jgi:hypothetical protein
MSMTINENGVSLENIAALEARFGAKIAKKMLRAFTKKLDTLPTISVQIMQREWDAMVKNG